MIYAKNTKELISYRFTLLLLVSLITAVSSFAQEQVFYPAPPADSTAKVPLKERPVAKRFGRAAFLLGISETAPFLSDRYIRNVDYAQIDFKSTGYNLNPVHWAWDDDDFGTNQFAHPYHGSLFYNSFRSNGYSFWQSVPAAFAGSYLWETFAEVQAPSINDFINTSFGGIILGEMTHRISNKIVNNRHTGFRRQVNEVIALLINPTNGFNRILDKRWGKAMRNSTEADSSKISGEFDIGQRKFNTGDKIAPRYGWYGRMRFLYGTPYENYRKPFSNMSIQMEFGKDDSSLINSVSVYGSLAGWEMKSTDKMKSYAILSANYNYINNEAFYYSAMSVKLNILTDLGLLRKAKVNTNVGLGVVVLGAVPDEYADVQNRKYNYGSGVSFNIGGGVNLLEKFYYGLNYRAGWLVTLNGNPSHFYLHTVTSEIRYMFIKNLSFCVEPGYYRLNGVYNNRPDINRSYPYIRLSVRYHLSAQQ
jgi:hypothetical protein